MKWKIKAATQVTEKTFTVHMWLKRGQQLLKITAGLCRFKKHVSVQLIIMRFWLAPSVFCSSLHCTLIQYGKPLNTIKQLTVALLFTERLSSGDKYTPLYIFDNKNEAHKANRDLKQIQIKGNTRLTVVLWALLQPPTLGVFCLGQTDLLVAEVEGLLAPVPVKLHDGNEVPDGSDDGEAQDRVNMDPWVLPCAVGESLVLQHKDQRRTLSPELHRAY